MNTKPQVNINFKKLETEFREAQMKENKYELENAAKFRAIEQKVATYEDFSEIVKASHLKPLEKKDSITTSSRNAVWNIAYVKKHSFFKEEENFTFEDEAKVIPKNHQQFLSAWRKLNGDKETQIARKMRLFIEIFKNNLITIIWKAGFGIMPEFITVAYQSYTLLNNCVSDHILDRDFSPDDLSQGEPSLDSEKVPASYSMIIGDLLLEISRISRHSLELQFLNAEERSLLVGLIDKLESSQELDSEKMAAIKLVYSISSKE